VNRAQSPIADLKPARTLTLDDDPAVSVAQFDLANVPAGPKLKGEQYYQGRHNH
jgi:hypothetical protein